LQTDFSRLDADPTTDHIQAGPIQCMLMTYKVVGYGSGQGRRDIETGGAAGLR
jgi:hypothetical protein